MGLAYRLDQLERSGSYFSWIQFAINQSMLDLFMDKNNPFSVLEEGAVYGYPVSSTLAFAGIIPAKKVRQKDVASYYLLGVNSKNYYEQEELYASNIWQQLRSIAPKLIIEAEEAHKR